MITGYLSLSQLISLKLMTDRDTLNTTMLKTLIQDDMKSQTKLRMAQGLRYYDAENDVRDHVYNYYINGHAHPDVARSNSRISHPFLKTLIDQKVSYIVGRPVLVSVAEPDVLDAEAPTDSEKAAMEAADLYEERLHDVLTDKFDDMVNDWVRGASKKAVEWVHCYYDQNREFKMVIIPGEQVIPVYDTQYENDLVAVIRYFIIDVIDAGGKSEQRYNVERWTKTGVEYFTQIDDGSFTHDAFVPDNPGPHWFTFNELTPTDRQSHSWGVVPFVPLLNNTGVKTDLQPIKQLSDAYDGVKSGWFDDLHDFAELVYVLKGYAPLSADGQQGMSELAKFLQNLKTNRVISVEGDGDVTTLKAEIPVEAKEKFLAITRKEIFYFGQGIDVDDENLGTASGQALKFRYSGLDMKADDAIRKLKDALGKLMFFVVQELNTQHGTKYDAAELIYTEQKNVITNEKETIDAASSSKGVISDKTILEHHPWVDDAEEEQKRIDAEKKKAMEEALVNLAGVDPNSQAGQPGDGGQPPPAAPAATPGNGLPRPGVKVGNN